MSGLFPPLREELRGIEPYGAPQLSLEQALAEVAGHIDALAGAEDLPAHSAAVRIRQK